MEGGSRCSLSTSPEAVAVVVDVINVVAVVVHIFDGRQLQRGGRTTRLPGGGGAANRMMIATNAPAATRAKERYLQLAGEEHTRYYSAAASSLSAPSAFVMPLREGYLRLVCC